MSEQSVAPAVEPAPAPAPHKKYGGFFSVRAFKAGYCLEDGAQYVPLSECPTGPLVNAVRADLISQIGKANIISISVVPKGNTLVYDIVVKAGSSVSWGETSYRDGPYTFTVSLPK